MSVPDQVQQGTNYDFCQTLNGDEVASFTYQLDVKQFPADVSSISRILTDVEGNTVKGTLTPAETDPLAIGLWYLIITSTDSDETIKETRRIEIKEKWV